MPTPHLLPPHRSFHEKSSGNLEMKPIDLEGLSAGSGHSSLTEMATYASVLVKKLVWNIPLEGIPCSSSWLVHQGLMLYGLHSHL